MRETMVLIGVGVFYGAVFLLRSWLHRRATGDWGVVVFSTRASGAARLASALLIAAAAASLAAPMFSLARIGAPLWDPLPWVDAAGASIAMIGAAGTWWSQSAMGTSWRVGVRDGERTSLVTGGPFRCVRNPIFSFVLATALGVALLLPHPASIASLLLLWLGVELQVRGVEEPHLRRMHGDGYLAYGRRVGRFLPGIGLLES